MNGRSRHRCSRRPAALLRQQCKSACRHSRTCQREPAKSGGNHANPRPRDRSRQCLFVPAPACACRAEADCGHGGDRGVLETGFDPDHLCAVTAALVTWLCRGPTVPVRRRDAGRPGCRACRVAPRNPAQHRDLLRRTRKTAAIAVVPVLVIFILSLRAQRFRAHHVEDGDARHRRSGECDAARFRRLSPMATASVARSSASPATRPQIHGVGSRDVKTPIPVAISRVRKRGSTSRVAPFPSTGTTFGRRTTPMRRGQG